MAKPFAVFDIDGTLIRWQLYHALADELAHRSILDPKKFQKVRQARMNWKKRSHEASFQDYENLLVKLINSALTSLKQSDLLEACQSVMNEYKDQAYTYTRGLVNQLRSQNYLLFAVSASQQEIVGLLADYYGFDDYGGSVYETKNGYYTGKSTVLRSEQKPIFLQGLIKKHGATIAGSLGVGDSESDIPMLSTVEQPIAFNPSKELFDHAKKFGWKIVLERKNVVYELETKDGRYSLG